MILFVVAPLNLSVQVLLADTSEWEGSCKHNIQEDTKSPHIDGFAIVILLAHDLGTHVARGSTEDLQHLG